MPPSTITTTAAARVALNESRKISQLIQIGKQIKVHTATHTLAFGDRINISEWLSKLYLNGLFFFSSEFFVSFFY